jgi:hypothetical protein
MNFHRYDLGALATAWLLATLAIMTAECHAAIGYDYVEFSMHRGRTDYEEKTVETTTPPGATTITVVPDYFHTEGYATRLLASLGDSFHVKAQLQGGDLVDGCRCTATGDSRMMLGWHSPWFDNADVYVEAGYEYANVQGSSDGAALEFGLRYAPSPHLEFEGYLAASSTGATFFDGSKRHGFAIVWRLGERFAAVLRGEETRWGESGFVIEDSDPGPGVTRESTTLQHDVTTWSLGIRLAY